MRARGIQFQQLLLGAALIAALAWNLAHAAEIRGLGLAAGPTGTRAELRLGAGAEFNVLSLANPDRLVVDLPGSALSRGFALPAPAGVVKSIRSGQPVAGTTRLVFDLASPVVVLTPRIEPGADGPRLVLEWPGDAAPNALAAAADTPAAPAEASADATARLIASLPPPATGTSTSTSTAPAQPQPTGRAIATPATPPPAMPPAMPTPVPSNPATPTPMDAAVARVAAPTVSVAEPPVPEGQGRTARNLRAGTRPLVIAIDPGHGGQDPGAVGPSGKREKDITLAIARELARQINATPGLKAHLTRDADVFIPLNRRAQLARAAGADMFISIHADAAENRSAKGSSVYVLSLKGASSQRARWLADKENASDLIGGGRLPQADNVLANVLVDLTQSGQMKASEDAGNHILAGLKRIGNNHKPHIERANFAVLRTSDMPAMLVETAFLSNPDEERRLVDPEFQRTVARAVLDGVNTFFTTQPPPGTLYAARAAAPGGEGGSAGGGSP